MPVERCQMKVAERRGREIGRSIEAVTLDFGNTLVAFADGAMKGIVDETAARAAEAWDLPPLEFAAVWAEERLRQFAFDVPAGREADMDVRAERVLARLRGCPPPAPDEDWEPGATSRWFEERETRAILDWYATAFVRRTPVPPGVGPILRQLAGHYRLAILSNWPNALSVERFVEAAGWMPYMRAVVISHRVGIVKPHPGIFETAALELGVASGPRLLHVGDDPGADVAGAHGVGWLAALVKDRPGSSPLPMAAATGFEKADLEIDALGDLPAALGLGGRDLS
jgi:FMN phosphatase YigB (HAD superfamily)